MRDLPGHAVPCECWRRPWWPGHRAAPPPGAAPARRGRSPHRRDDARPSERRRPSAPKSGG
eukprot:9238558-Alexandrium_andersonii.AAC.1